MADPVVREAVKPMLREEVLPLLPEVGGIDPPAYLDGTLQRFADPAIGDGPARLARRGKVKTPSYLHACRELGIDPAQAVAVEDSIPGAQSAVAAGMATIGNLQFVQPAEREQREKELRDTGVVAVVTSWSVVEQRVQERSS